MTAETPATFLIFSGHNDRAAIALCRYFAANNVTFVVAAREENDVIRDSHYRDRIVFTRRSPQVSVALFREVADAAGGRQLVYCPTTEFINLFLLKERAEVEALGYTIPLASAELYSTLTNKQASAAYFDGTGGMEVPRMMSVGEARAPCVLKPRENLADGRILYPLICKDGEALAAARRREDIGAYFAQDYVDGQSLYFCSYMDRNGHAEGFWQRNLGQQHGGKSIVLAREETAIPDDLHRLQSAVLSRLSGSAYEGPIMIEVRRRGEQTFFIEMNPRFWGPLQLAVDVCPEILERFVRGAVSGFRPHELPTPQRPAYYAWTGGMAEWEPLDVRAEVDDADARRHTWDVFARKDYADVERS